MPISIIGLRFATLIEKQQEEMVKVLNSFKRTKQSGFTEEKYNLKGYDLVFLRMLVKQSGDIEMILENPKS